MNTSTLGHRFFTGTLLLVVAAVTACSAGVGSAGTVGPRSATESPELEPSASATASATATATGAPATGTPGSRPTAAPTRTPQPPTGKMSLKIYLLDYQGSDESPPVLVAVNRDVNRTVGVATSATRQLIAGPTDDERAHNLVLGTLGTAVPGRTILLGITIQNGLATVDLSREFESAGDTRSTAQRFAQVVYTVTQFSTVNRVNFRLDGQPTQAIDGRGAALDRPATRNDYLGLLPAIFVDEPAWGGDLTDPVRLSGKANVFEAQFMAALVRWDADGDHVLVRRSVHATCGTGCWGDFSASLDVPSAISSSAEIHVRVWEPSAKDGSPTNVLEYPVR